MSSLKTSIEHFYSSQENHGLELVKVKLDTTDLDEKEALENGWLIEGNKWYQCRSVRIDLSKFKDNLRLPSNFTIEYTKDCSMEIMDIYEEYIQYKQFNKPDYPFWGKERMSFLVLKDSNIPVAFTKFMHYTGGLESQINAWNYHKPELSVGKRIITYEVDYAKSLGLDYLYIGEGCEIGCLYKAELKGFEWWTGSEWSTDEQKYKQLCIRDSNIKTLEDLGSVFNQR